LGVSLIRCICLNYFIKINVRGINEYI